MWVGVDRCGIWVGVGCGDGYGWGGVWVGEG